MGVSCQILINESRDGVHKSGGTVTGVIKYVIHEPTEYKEVKLSLLGKGQCHWSVTDSDYTGTEDYVQSHLNIAPNQSVVLHGVYEYPFKFYIPENIPTTFKDQYAWITYQIRLKFVKSRMLSYKKVFKADIPIYGTVDQYNSDGQPAPEGPMIFGLEKSPFAIFSVGNHTIDLKGEIAKTRLMPGEDAHISFKVTNRSKAAVSSVKAELYCYTTYRAEGGMTFKHNEKVKRCERVMPGVPIDKHCNYKCVVPTRPECYSIQHSKIISKQYIVRVTLHLPMPHANAFVEIPVAIGERKSTVVDSSAENLDTPYQSHSKWAVMPEGNDDWELV